MADGRAGELCVVLNPTSGSGAGRRVLPEVKRELDARGIRHRLVLSEFRGHARELAYRAAQEGVAAVVAAGGDGTIHDVANGLLEAGAGATTALGVIPIGRGNDFVKVLPGTTPRPLAYDTLERARRRAIDVGRVTWEDGGEWFVNAMGTGIDVEVVRQIERIRGLPASLVYVVGLVRALVRYSAIPLFVHSNGQSRRSEVMLIAVANGTCVGGSFRLTPDASPDDGLLDLCVVDRVGLAGAARVAPRVMRGTHAGMAVVHTHRASEVVIEAAGGDPLFFQLDGELREPEGVRRLRVSVEPGALHVYAAPESHR